VLDATEKMAHDVGSHDVGVRIERGKGATAVVWLEREPVNSMSLEFWRALADALSALERDPKVRSTRSTRSTRSFRFVSTRVSIGRTH
jgi:enoyl-CoA hydratase/carnithine racemase